MSRYEDYFKDIDFDKEWNESDWAHFFDAQDKLQRDIQARTRLVPRGGGRDRGLGFRRVLAEFGMDPDAPQPEPFETSSEYIFFEGPRSIPFWEEAAEVGTLPLYNHSQALALWIADLCQSHFPKIAKKSYKSLSHKRLQSAVRDLCHHAPQIPRLVAAGHGVGYSTDRVKGNIVRCQMALFHADACVGVLNRFPQGHLPPEDDRRLFRAVLQLRNDILNWISHLRERFVPTGR